MFDVNDALTQLRDGFPPFRLTPPTDAERERAVAAVDSPYRVLQRAAHIAAESDNPTVQQAVLNFLTTVRLAHGEEWAERRNRHLKRALGEDE